MEVVNFGTPSRHNSYAPGTGIFKIPDAQTVTMKTRTDFVERKFVYGDEIWI